MRRAQDEPADSPPQQQQRGKTALVFGAHEGAAELDRRIEGLQEPGPVFEQRLRIQSPPAVALDDFVGETHAVSPDDHFGLRVPYEQVQVVGIEKVYVRGLVRAFAGRAKAQLAQPPDFLKAPRNLRGARVLDGEISACDQALLGGQALDFRLEERAWYRGRDRHWRGDFRFVEAAPRDEPDEHASKVLHEFRAQRCRFHCMRFQGGAMRVHRSRRGIPRGRLRGRTLRENGGDRVARLAREPLAGSPGRRERRGERQAHGDVPGSANRADRLPQGHAVDERGVAARLSIDAVVSDGDGLHRPRAVHGRLQQSGTKRHDARAGARRALRENGHAAAAGALEKQGPGARGEPADGRPVPHLLLGNEDRGRVARNREDIEPGNVIRDEQRARRGCGALDAKTRAERTHHPPRPAPRESKSHGVRSEGK